MSNSPFATNPRGFDSPTQLPATQEEAAEWQEANRTFWETTPMRYDWKERIGAAEFSNEFYDEIDSRFLTDSKKYLPWKKTPFDPLIDFDLLKSQDVLEIGVGNGTHAQLLASHAKSFTGIDLTQYAATSTANRLKLRNLPGTVMQMDAEKMTFPDNSFDFIWSWGVIHHSSNTRQILSEMNRVLRPGGSATVMVYHRSFWHKYVMAGFFHGVVKGQLFRKKSLHRVLQHNTDGAIARNYTPTEWRKEVQNLFSDVKISVCGSKAEMYPIPAGKLKNALMTATPDMVTRFFTNSLRCGWFLVAEMKVIK
jgi:ubiquinone/menaquinone biosynthesis C-methylase UbiE